MPYALIFTIVFGGSLCIALAALLPSRRGRVFCACVAMVGLGMLLVVAADLIERNTELERRQGEIMKSYRELLQLKISAVKSEIDTIRKETANATDKPL